MTAQTFLLERALWTIFRVLTFDLTPAAAA